ncbi:MAG: ketoacyl-ACP synthase III [Sandaracinaceae bacterium]|nr:ketoacyl-ACP synthase III [Sandaracinaceae bacterium]
MIRAKILGLGSYVPPRVVRNDEIPFLDDQHVPQETRQTETNDEWIRARTGIEERRYVDTAAGVTTSDLALEASRRALEDAGVDAKEIDCIILGTLSPDIHFPGTAVFLQSKLGIDGEDGCACYDIRQQCSGFVYGLEMADAFIRTGKYRKVLLVGAELHSNALDFTTRGRDVMVLFGDGAGAVVVGAVESDDEREGVLYTHAAADGSGAWNLYLKVFDISKSPIVHYDATAKLDAEQQYPQMVGKKVFLHAVRNMVVATNRALEKTGLTWKDIDWFVPHQANLRINEAVVEYAEIPKDKALNTIMWYGNTTAATVPLTIDHWRKEGRVKKGDLVLSTVFGAGFTWGSAIFRL